MTGLRVVNGYAETNLSILTMFIRTCTESSFRELKRRSDDHDL